MKKSSTTSPPELMSLDIDSLVKEARDETSPISQSSIEEPDRTSNEEDTKTSLGERNVRPSSNWENCLSYIDYFKVSSSPENRRRSYQIEENILETLEGCNIHNSTVTNIINAALRSFIDEHKINLRTTLKTASLIFD